MSNTAAKSSQQPASAKPAGQHRKASRRARRGHLNGLALRDGALVCVTAVSKSDTIDVWRDRRADGGVVIDVQSGKIVCEGLSVPHSPSCHDGSNEPVFNTAARFDPVTGDGIVILSTGNPFRPLLDFGLTSNSSPPCR